MTNSSSAGSFFGATSNNEEVTTSLDTNTRKEPAFSCQGNQRRLRPVPVKLRSHLLCETHQETSDLQLVGLTTKVLRSASEEATTSPDDVITLMSLQTRCLARPGSAGIRLDRRTRRQILGHRCSLRTNRPVLVTVCRKLTALIETSGSKCRRRPVEVASNDAPTPVLDARFSLSDTATTFLGYSRTNKSANALSSSSISEISICRWKRLNDSSKSSRTITRKVARSSGCQSELDDIWPPGCPSPFRNVWFSAGRRAAGF